MELLNIVNSVSNQYEEETVKPEEVVSQNESLTTHIRPSDIYVYKGRGAELFTNKGRLLDLSSMTVNAILGQNDPWVKAHMIAYMMSDRPSFLSTRFGSKYYYLLAARLSKMNFVEDSVINHRQCNGSDVTELAILSAFASVDDKNRKKLLSFTGSYHGQNLTSYLSSDLQQKNIFWINPNEVQVEFVNPPEGALDEERILSVVNDMRGKLFGMILEPIQVNNNVYSFSPEFLKELKKICDEEDISLIYDEIQSGFGWLGAMSAAEMMGVKPDMMALSKGLTGGFGPMAALAVKRRFETIPYGTGEKTNGSDVRALVAANAILDRLEGIPESQIPENVPGYLREELSRGLLSYVPEKARIIDEFLNRLQGRFGEGTFELKGSQLIRGITFKDAEKLNNLYSDLMAEGVYVRKSKNSLIIKPPLNITYEQLEEATDKIEKIFKKHLL